LAGLSASVDVTWLHVHSPLPPVLLPPRINHIARGTRQNRPRRNPARYYEAKTAAHTEPMSFQKQIDANCRNAQKAPTPPLLAGQRKYKVIWRNKTGMSARSSPPKMKMWEQEELSVGRVFRQTCILMWGRRSVFVVCQRTFTTEFDATRKRNKANSVLGVLSRRPEPKPCRARVMILRNKTGMSPRSSPPRMKMWDQERNRLCLQVS